MDWAYVICFEKIANNTCLTCESHLMESYPSMAMEELLHYGALMMIVRL